MRVRAGVGKGGTSRWFRLEVLSLFRDEKWRSSSTRTSARSDQGFLGHVGSACRGRGLKPSFWSNHDKVSIHGRDRCLSLHARELNEKPVYAEVALPLKKLDRAVTLTTVSHPSPGHTHQRTTASSSNESHVRGAELVVQGARAEVGH